MNEVEFTRELKEKAESYYELGFNITGLKNGAKRPYHPWEKFQKQRQTRAEALFHEWADLSGIGVVSGVSGLFCLDFDSCDLAHLPMFLEKLGLPLNYNWVVISGSGKGFHIWFSCEQMASRMENVSKTVQVYLPKTEGLFKQLELRINCHVVVPPSKSAIGGEYKFLHHNDLSTRPTEITYEIDQAIS